jgi:hypothetical protein
VVLWDFLLLHRYNSLFDNYHVINKYVKYLLASFRNALPNKLVSSMIEF